MIALLVVLAVAAPETYTLDNGLRVVLEVRRDLPTIAVRFGFSIGRADESDQTAGAMAMVRALANQPMPSLNDRSPRTALYLHGASPVDSFLGFDSMAFGELVAPSELEGALWVESHRAQLLEEDYSDEVIERTRWIAGADTRGTERSLRSDASLRNAAVVWNKLFPLGHPYHRRDVAKIDRHVLAKVAPLFVPSNAVLVLVGDLPDAVRDNIRTYFGAFPPGVPHVRPPVNAPPAVAFAELAHQGVIAWTFTPETNADCDLGDIVAQLINDGDDLRAESSDYASLSMFRVTAYGASSTPEDRIATITRRLIEVRNSVDPAAITRAERRLQMASMIRQQDPWERTSTYFVGTVHGKLQHNLARDRYSGFTPRDVVHFIDAHLSARPAITETQLARQ